MTKGASSRGYMELDSFVQPWPYFNYSTLLELLGKPVTVRKASYNKIVPESYKAKNVCCFFSNPTYELNSSCPEKLSIFILLSVNVFG